MVGGSRKRRVRGHLRGFKRGGWVKKTQGQRPLMGLQIWWVAQRSDATLEALVGGPLRRHLWWSVGGGGGLRKFKVTFCLVSGPKKWHGQSLEATFGAF